MSLTTVQRVSSSLVTFVGEAPIVPCSLILIGIIAYAAIRAYTVIRGYNPPKLSSLAAIVPQSQVMTRDWENGLILPEIMNLIFMKLTLVEVARASSTSREWCSYSIENIREREKRISTDTVLWARESYFVRFYSEDPDVRIRHEIEQKAPPPQHPKYGIDLLGCAIRNLRVETVKELLALGYDPNQRNLDRLLPFHNATIGSQWNIAASERFEQCKEILIALIRAGFNLNQDGHFIYHLATLGKPSGELHDIFAFCVEKGLNVNYQDPARDGKTLMHEILELGTDGNAKCIDYLLELKADPTIPNNQRETPISIARERGFTETLKAFRKWNYIV